MKKFYIFLCLAIASLTELQAQAPQGFNYQATVRNSSGDLIVNTNVYFKFNVIQGSQTAVPIFTETHYVPTDDLGQVNLVIGQGTANTGVFSELDWSLGSYYLGIELDTGNGYVAMGTTQLLSVPYALYAESSGSSSSGFPSGGTEGQVLSIVSGVPTWTDVSGSTDSENLAEITTVEASNIDFESMISGGNINNDGGFTVVSKGVIWSESPDPTPELETKTDEGGGASSFTSTITGLDEETEYFYRAYATTSVGTAYGSTYSFITDSSQFYDQDGDGFTPDQGDCNDYDANEYPGQIWYFDQDGDGYAQDTNESCTRPGGGLLLSEISGAGDCDDTNPNVYPGATELEDGIDNDCDGLIDENENISAFEGTYTVSEVFTGGTNEGLQLAAAFGQSYQVELAMVEGDSTASTMLVTNSDGFDTYYPAGTIMTFYLNGTIDLYDGANFNIPFLAGFDYHLINTTSYDFTTGIIVFSGDFGSPTNYGPYQTTLIKAVDNDNDGYYINLDCDDTNAQINPGATEIEDGIDNDCDGQIDEGFGHSGISGTWRLAPEAGALGVGPELDNISWWSNTSDDVTTRACLFDDTYVFNADGSFQNVVGSETWIETWQGAATEGCGTPVAPHDGSATATYTYDEAAGTITLDGVGAYLVLAKAINGGELASPADAPGSVTYIASLSADGLTLELDIEVAGGGHWSFKLARQ